jgi:acyl-CoA thioester hydrolase
VRHDHRVQLRWSDPDSYGHVNHARALSLLEDARLALAASVPGTTLGRLPDIILARLEVDYLHQLYYRAGETLTVRSWIARIGTKSVTIRQELVQDGRAAIRADGICVMFDVRTDTSRALTDDERAFWTRYLEE